MYDLPEMTKAKAVVSGIGITLTALTTALAAVSVALNDDALDLTEISAVLTALLTAGAAIYAVWRTPNKPVDQPKRQ